MNERLKELILEAGFPTFGGMYVVSSGEELKHFAELVRQDEREACAEICDWISEHYETRTDLNQTQKQVGQLAAEVCGVRIRERSDK